MCSSASQNRSMPSVSDELCCFRNLIHLIEFHKNILQQKFLGKLLRQNYGTKRSSIIGYSFAVRSLRCQDYLLCFTVEKSAETTSRPTNIPISELQNHIETMDEKAYKDEFKVNYYPLL